MSKTTNPRPALRLFVAPQPEPVTTECIVFGETGSGHGMATIIRTWRDEDVPACRLCPRCHAIRDHRLPAGEAGSVCIVLTYDRVTQATAPLFVDPTGNGDPSLFKTR